jgi:hypothetical protein
MAEERDLPGWPKKRLVKRVRSHLWRYGIRPKGAAWRATWSWAYAIANSYFRLHWPLASEIATQYVVLLLAEMKENRALNLPYRADQVMPDDVKQRLPTTQLPLLPAPGDREPRGESPAP